MKWHVFVGRRRLDVEEWLKSTKLRSYDALLAWCKSENVEPPSRDEMKGKFGSKRKPVPVNPAPEPEEPKKAEKPPKRAKKAPKVAPEPSK